MAYKEKLTDEEREWVKQLQESLRSHHRGDPTRNEKLFGKVTEFDIALHAIITKDEPHKAVKRLKRLKAFKQRYSVHNDTTVYEAIKIVSIFLSNHPNFLQAFNKDKFGRWVIYFNLKALSTTASSSNTADNDNNNNNIDDMERFKALYYIFHALQPDLDSIRNGTIWIGDFQEITRQDVFGLMNGGRALCRDSYPIKVKDFPCLNSPTVLSATYAICRPFLSQRVKEVMAIDCNEPMVQKHFSKSVLPPKLGGTQRPIDIMDIIEQNLKRRFENEELFKLQLLSSPSSPSSPS